MRLIQVSDMHFGGEDTAAVSGLSDWLSDKAYDLLVVSGDFTLVGAPDQFAAAKAWLDGLKGPKLFTPGNHDTPYHNVAYRLFAPWTRYRRAFGAVDGDSASGEGWSATAINTARGVQMRADWSKGQIELSQVEQALSRLADHGLRVLACHHPLIEMLGAPITGAVIGGEDAAMAMALARIDLVLTGHVHVPFALAMPYGDRRTYAVGSGTLSRRLRGAPAGFNLIEIEEACITVVAQGWTGSHYEPWRTWALDRRT